MREQPNSEGKMVRTDTEAFGCVTIKAPKPTKIEKPTPKFSKSADKATDEGDS